MANPNNRNETTARVSYTFGETTGAFGLAAGALAAAATPASQDAINLGQGESAGSAMTISESHLEDKLTALEARIDVRIVDARRGIEVSDAKAETKYEKLLSELKLLGEKIGGISSDVTELKTSVGRVESKTTNTRIIIVTTVIGAALTIVGLTYGIIGYGHQVADTIAAAFAAGQAEKNDNAQTGD